MVWGSVSSIDQFLPSPRPFARLPFCRHSGSLCTSNCPHHEVWLWVIGWEEWSRARGPLTSARFWDILVWSPRWDSQDLVRKVAGRDLHGFAVPGARNGEFLGVEAIQQAVPVLECYQLEKLNLTALPSRPKPWSWRIPIPWWQGRTLGIPNCDSCGKTKRQELSISFQRVWGQNPLHTTGQISGGLKTHDWLFLTHNSGKQVGSSIKERKPFVHQYVFRPSSNIRTLRVAFLCRSLISCSVKAWKPSVKEWRHRGCFFSGKQLSFVPFAFVLSEGWKSFG